MKTPSCEIIRRVRWRTLIADDSPEECQLIEACLSLIPEVAVIGFVHDGNEAIAYLTGKGHFADRDGFPYPDLLLLDFRMPACDGMQVLAALKRRPRRPRIVLWSNTLREVDEKLALRLGADLVCQKPRGLSELMELFACVDSKPAPDGATAERKRLEP